MYQFWWQARYAVFMWRCTGAKIGFCWESATVAAHDLSADDDLSNYDPIDSASDEMSYWEDDGD